MLFQDDTVVTKYNGHLETWFEHRQDPNDAYQTEEEIFQAIEVIAKLRKPPHKPPKAVVSRLRPDPGNIRTTLAQRNHTATSSSSGSDSDANPGDDADGEDGDAATNEVTKTLPAEADAWKSNHADDENMDLTNERPKRKRSEQKRMNNLNEKDLNKCGKKVALTEAEYFLWSWNERQEFLRKKEKNRSSTGRSRHVGGEAKKKIAIAIALKKIAIALKREQENDDDDDPETFNDPECCEKHPQYKQNTCRYCFKHKTVYYCSKCSNPKEMKKRKEKGPKGGDKHTTAGYMHFCNHGGCYAKHKCGHVKARRTKKEMAAAKARGY